MLLLGVQCLDEQWPGWEYDGPTFQVARGLSFLQLEDDAHAARLPLVLESSQKQFCDRRTLPPQHPASAGDPGSSKRRQSVSHSAPFAAEGF